MGVEEVDVAQRSDGVGGSDDDEHEKRTDQEGLVQVPVGFGGHEPDGQLGLGEGTDAHSEQECGDHGQPFGGSEG